MSEVMKRLLGEYGHDDPIEIIRDDRGRPTHFKGLNGKLWQWPIVPYQGDIELFKALSVACYGRHPELNELEQQAFDDIYPAVAKSFEVITESNGAMLDDLASGTDGEWWYRKTYEADHSDEAYNVAYKIAETLVAKGWTRNEHTQTGI